MSDPIKLALLGKDLRHSVSSELHQLLLSTYHLAEFQAMQDRPLSYELVDCEAECDVAQWIKTAPANGFVGANVTRPYKELAHRLATRSSESAELCDSVNTLAFFDGDVVGESTDGTGLLFAMRRELGDIDLSGMDWYVYGFGGAARSCLVRLLEVFQPRSLSILVRNAENVADSANEILQTTGHWSVPIQVFPFESVIAGDNLGSKFVLQTTPLGQEGYASSDFSMIGWQQGDIAIDLVYNPLKTAFVNTAQRQGAMTMGGLGMLIEQAALSQCFWFTGRLPPESILTNDEYLSIKSALSGLLA